MAFGRLGALGRGFGALGSGLLGSASGSAAPTAPVLAMDPAWDTTQATPLWIIDAAWADQDDLQFEVQTAAGDWSGATVTNHTVTTSEITGTEIDFPGSALANGDYEARCKFKHSGGSYSAYSNTVSFTVAAVANGIELEGTTDLIELEDSTDTILLEDAA